MGTKEKNLDVDLIFKIAAIGMLVSVLCQVLSRAGREDMATLATLAGLVAALWLVVGAVAEFFGDVKSLFELY